MTKATEALGWFDMGDIIESCKVNYPNDYEQTIRKALELLDRVERGGCNIDTLLKQVEIFYSGDFKRLKTASYVVKSMGEKYILIERE
jgi:uncharacterized FAD-dependent dehydrogenase